VLGLSGEARSQGLQELWQIAHDQNTHIPLFGLNYIHGISPKLHWDPVKRNDIVRVCSILLNGPLRCSGVAHL
jgi:hypothetical protein